MILYAEILNMAIDKYNSNRKEEQHLDYWEVIDEISDTKDQVEMLSTIIEIFKEA